MYFLQVVESEGYSLLADENRINLRLLPPPRGKILDRNGFEVAGNQRNYRVIIVPEQTKSVSRTLESLKKIYPLGNYEISKILREVKRRKGFVPVTVAENLTWEEFESQYINQLTSDILENYLVEISKENIIFLCSETEPNFCHRQILTNELLKIDSSLNIIHLMP